MSAQREIHQWLYNKIILLEKIEEDIVQWATNQGFPANEWMQDITESYGKPTGAVPLKKATGKANIHLWLYEALQSSELRQAALLTAILNERPESKDNIAEIFTKHGENSAQEFKDVVPGNPEELYIVLNDFLLDGMPNQRVNDILSGSENVIIWRTTKCMHKPFWDEVDGDIQHFYDFRGAWVKAFVETLTPELAYERRPNGDHKIVKK